MQHTELWKTKVIKNKGCRGRIPRWFQGGAQLALAGVEGGLSPHSEARMRLFQSDLGDVNMKACIISNGIIQDYTFYRPLIAQVDFIICADGGLSHAKKLGVTPDILIGDLDSVPPNLSKQGITVAQYAREKDETDTQLAVAYVLEKGYTDIHMIGSLGGRFDHAFANVALLKMILDKGAKGCIIDEKNEIYLIDKNIQIQGKVGDTVSLLPISEKVEGIATQGLKYALKGAQMVFGIPYGVSNVFTQSQASVSISKGLLLVMKVRD